MVDVGGMRQAQLAILIGVLSPVISDLFKYGKASQQVIKKINAYLDIK